MAVKAISIGSRRYADAVALINIPAEMRSTVGRGPCRHICEIELYVAFYRNVERFPALLHGEDTLLVPTTIAQEPRRKAGHVLNANAAGAFGTVIAGEQRF